MGIGIGFSSDTDYSTCDDNVRTKPGFASMNDDKVVSSGYTESTKTDPNPNKYKFKIEWASSVPNKGTILLVVYPNCTTFAGRKVLVFNRVIGVMSF